MSCRMVIDMSGGQGLCLVPHWVGVQSMDYLNRSPYDLQANCAISFVGLLLVWCVRNGDIIGPVKDVSLDVAWKLI